MTYGRLAQLVEHLLDVQEVTGSSPVPSTTSPQTKKVWGLFSWWRYRTRTARPRRRRGNKHPVGCLLVRGSQRLGMSTKKDAVIRSGDFFVVDGTGLEQQQRRPRPAAETGRSCWGSVLIFQGPAKGLKKNQQTQPVRRCAAPQAISPVGCCLARGSQRLGMSTRKEQRQGMVSPWRWCPAFLLCISLYCAFRTNRCVPPYMAGTHVRRKKGRV